MIRIYLFSFFYRITRFFVKTVVSFFQSFLGRKQDLESIVDFGDRNLVRIDNYLGYFAYQFSTPQNLYLELYNLKFNSPLIASSFKSEKDLIGIWLKLGLGGAILKTIMDKPRIGNNRPRLQQIRLERQSCLVNALGLPGEGIENFSNSIANSTLWEHGKPLGISIGGENYREYVTSFDILNKSLSKIEIKNYFYELNISCPNTDTGSCLGDDLERLENLIDYMQLNSSAVISIKISPDWNNKHLANIGDLIAPKDKIIINAGNTQFKTTKYLGLEEKHLPRGGGGLSGVAIFPRTLELVNLFSDMDLTIMATGGISTIHHLNAVRDAGASLYGMATSLIMDPYCIPKINQKLSKQF